MKKLSLSRAFGGAALALALGLGAQGGALAQVVIDSKVVVSGPPVVVLPGETSQPSPWAVGDVLQVGVTTAATLRIVNGGVVSSTAGRIGVSGVAGSGTGVVTIDGADSQWNLDSLLNVGLGGTGTLTLSNGGSVTAPTGILLTNGGSGTLNIGAPAGQPPVAPGIVAAGTSDIYTGGPNNSTIVFNHTDTSGNYVFSTPIDCPIPSCSGEVLVNVISGTTVFTGRNTYGRDATSITSVANATLRAGAANTLSPNSEMRVISTGVLDLNGFNQTIPKLLLATDGTVKMGNTGVATLTVSGDYAGGDPPVTTTGTLMMSGALASGGSDVLVVNGNASGTTVIHYSSLTAAGAATSGDGILLVQLNGASNTATFQLGAPLTAGAYSYELAQGASNANWYLRSTLDCALPTATTAPECATALTAAATTGITAPATGNAPSGAATVASGSHYTAGTVTWSPTDDPFAPGTAYTATVTLTADTGYTFTGLAAADATIDGNVAAIVSNTGDALTLSYQFPATAAAIASAAVSITAPADGRAPSAAATPAAGSHYTASPVTWSPADNPFKAGTSYTATVTLTAEAGYTFAGLAAADATLNGQAASSINVSAAGDAVTITYVFPPLAPRGLGGDGVASVPALGELALALLALLLAGAAARFTPGKPLSGRRAP